MGLNDHRRVLGNVASRLLCAALNSEGTKATKIDILFLYCHTLADFFHKSLYSGGNILFGESCVFNNFVDYICFCHLLI